MQAYLDAMRAGRYFAAHDHLEARWRVTGSAREKAAIWLAAAFYHWQHGNSAGAVTLLRRTAAAAPEPLRERVETWARRAAAGTPCEPPTEGDVKALAVWLAQGLPEAGENGPEAADHPGLIVVTTDLPAVARERLTALGPVRWYRGNRPIPRATLKKWLHEARVLVATLNDRIDAEVLDEAPRLQLVASIAVGYDHLDLDALRRYGVLATNTPDVLTEATAELTWALLLALTRNVLAAREALLAGAWTHWRLDGFLGTELTGKTLGIVGLGRIGQAVARRAPGFGMAVLGLDPGPDHRVPPGFPVAPRETFLARADVVSLHVPLTPITRGLVDETWLVAMKPGSFLVNTSRGAVVDETALLGALEAGHLAGAALDVFAREPVDPDHPLVRHPRVLATPHIGSATVETRTAMALRAVANVEAFLRGRRPPDLVDPAVWETRFSD